MQSTAAANKDAEQPDETAILLQAASVLIQAASKRVFVAKDYDSEEEDISSLTFEQCNKERVQYRRELAALREELEAERADKILPGFPKPALAQQSTKKKRSIQSSKVTHQQPVKRVRSGDYNFQTHPGSSAAAAGPGSVIPNLRRAPANLAKAKASGSTASSLRGKPILMRPNTLHGTSQIVGLRRVAASPVQATVPKLSTSQPAPSTSRASADEQCKFDDPADFYDNIVVPADFDQEWDAEPEDGLDYPNHVFPGSSGIDAEKKTTPTIRAPSKAGEGKLNEAGLASKSLNKSASPESLPKSTPSPAISNADKENNALAEEKEYERIFVNRPDDTEGGFPSGYTGFKRLEDPNDKSRNWAEVQCKLCQRVGHDVHTCPSNMGYAISTGHTAGKWRKRTAEGEKLGRGPAQWQNHQSVWWDMVNQKEVYHNIYS